MCVDNTVEEYEAEITEIDLGSENTNKNFVLEITDQRLLQKTGGIVQGNSGSPVLQNGRLIGAITHVFVNHQKKATVSLRKTCLHGTEKYAFNLVEIVTNFRIFTENVDRIFKKLREIY